MMQAGYRIHDTGEPNPINAIRMSDTIRNMALWPSLCTLSPVLCISPLVIGCAVGTHEV